MDTDPEIANWVLEFLLRQSLEIGTLKSLFCALPPASDNENLTKLVLLKKLECDTSVSESILDVFYDLEQVEFVLGNEKVSDTMKRAFCAAAVECTVRNLKGEDEAMTRFKFFEAVKRVWKGKIARMKKGGLGSEALWAWKDEMEKAVWDDVVYGSVLKKSGEVNVVEAVNAYIREEREKMGPSFLESVAGTVKSDANLQGILGIDQVGVKEMNKGEVASGNPRGASNAEVEKAGEAEDNQASAGGDNMSHEPRPSSIAPRTRESGEVNAYIREERDKTGPSFLELVAERVKNDEALQRILEVDQVAEPPSGVKELNKVELSSGNPRGATIVDHSGPSCSAQVEKAGEVVQRPPEDNQASAAGVAQAPGDNEPRLSTIKRNNASSPHEWDESFVGSQEERGMNLKKRRQSRAWSLQEEDTLRNEVEVHGKGNWKLILKLNPETFVGRTDGDLKDKWRNMTQVRNTPRL